jgi:hypothetical protein
VALLERRAKELDVVAGLCFDRVGDAKVEAALVGLGHLGQNCPTDEVMSNADRSCLAHDKTTIREFRRGALELLVRPPAQRHHLADSERATEDTEQGQEIPSV